MKNGKVAMVDVRDIAAVAAATLTSTGHEGKTYWVSGPESLSYRDVADIFSAVLGKKVTYVDVPLEASRKRMLELGMSERLTNGLNLLAVFLSQGGAARVGDVVAQLARKKPISFKEFMQNYLDFFKGQQKVAM